MSTVRRKTLYVGLFILTASLVALVLLRSGPPRGDAARPGQAAPSGSAVAKSRAAGGPATRGTSGAVSASQAGANAILDEEWLDRSRRLTEVQTLHQTFHQVMVDGMRLTDQPQGYMNRLIRPSPDGRHVAFLSTKEDTCRIIVVDRQTGVETVVPTPRARIFEARSIQQLEWADGGKTLYAVEDATDGVSEKAAWATLGPNELSRETKRIYNVLYSWKQGEAEVHVLDRVEPRVLTMDAADGGVRVLSQSREKGWDHVDLREYRGNRPVSTKTFHVSRNGQSVDYQVPQLLSKQNELWFISGPTQPGGRVQRSLAVMDLNAPQPEARLITPNVSNFSWAPDGERLIFKRDEAGEGMRSKVSFYLVRRDALDQPVLLTSKDVNFNDMSPEFAGLSQDGRTLYVQALTKPKVDLAGLSEPGNLQIYQYDLPN